MSSGSHILLLETATKVCSVALARDGEVIACKEASSDQYIHSEKLNVFIQEVLDEAKVSMPELNAVCVSAGPGSYTGLRIGISAAKGLCFALEIPLLSVRTLETLAAGCFMQDEWATTCCPMIDARRMEVYTACYDRHLNELSAPEAVVVDHRSFSGPLSRGPLWFVGDGAAKCQEILNHENARFDVPIAASARWIARLAQRRLEAEQFEDLAYFVPFYLKAYHTGKKKSIQ